MEFPAQYQVWSWVTTTQVKDSCLNKLPKCSDLTQYKVYFSGGLLGHHSRIQAGFVLYFVFPFSFSQYIGKETCSTLSVTHTTLPYIPLGGTSYRVLPTCREPHHWLTTAPHAEGRHESLIDGYPSLPQEQIWVRLCPRGNQDGEDVQGETSEVRVQVYSISEIFKNAFWTIKGVNVRIQKIFFPCFHVSLKYVSSSFHSPFFSSLDVKAFAESFLSHIMHIYFQRASSSEKLIGPGSSKLLPLLTVGHVSAFW